MGVLSWHIRKMLMQNCLSLWLFIPPIVLSQFVSDPKLICPYPLPSSLKPYCSCVMQAEYSGGTKKVLLGSFAKALECNFDEDFDFVRIVEAFDYDNNIASLELYGELDRKYFLTKEDLGRLNVSRLVIGTKFSKDQQLFEPGALEGSKGLLHTLEVKYTNTYKVQEKEGHLTLNFLKEICQDLQTLVVHGVSILKSEDFDGCSQLTHLTLKNTNLAIIGPDFFKHLSSIEFFHFSSHAKFWIQTGAFRNLPNLTTVELSAVTYNAGPYSLLDEKSEHCNKTVISNGAFDSLPNLSTLTFCETYCYGDLTVDLFEENAFLGLEKLKKFIVLKGNQASLPRLFDNAPKLNIFKFQSGLKVVEANAFEGLPSLTEIDLSDNKITRLNNAFQNIPTYLRKIDLSKNQITSLGNVSGDLSYLKKINLKENTKLTSVNKDFLKLFENIEKYENNKYRYGRSNHFQVEMNGIPLDCGCDIRWLFGNTNMLHYFGRGAMCGDSVIALKDVQDYKLLDIHNSDDFSVKTEDLYEKTILDLTCPPNKEF